MKIELYLTPLPFSRSCFEAKAVVVIDVLRCSTSICAAISAGARGVIPTPGPGEAVEMWTKVGSDNAVLAGERHGVKIENFELGNSPGEFTPETVGNKLVVMTTTNGTALFGKAAGAATIMSAALVNISRVAQRVADDGRDLMVACSGREGGFSIEDTICGGMLIHKLATEHELSIELNDAGSLALLLYRSNQNALHRTIEQGEHARFLVSIGFGEDVQTATAVDSLPVLPVLKDGLLVAETASAADSPGRQASS